MFSNLAKSCPQTTTPAHGCCTQWLPAAGTGDGWNWGWVKLGTDGTGDMEVGKDADHCDPSQLSRTGSRSTSTACVCQWCQRRDPWNQRDEVLAVNAQAGQGLVPGLRLPDVLPTCRSPPLPHPHWLGFGQHLGMGWGPKAAGAEWAGGEASLGKAVQKSSENRFTFIF